MLISKQTDPIDDSQVIIRKFTTKAHCKTQ